MRLYRFCNARPACLRPRIGKPYGMSNQLQSIPESLESMDRRTGLLVGLGVLSVILLVVGLLVALGPGRSALDRRNDIEEELGLEDSPLESLTD